LLNRKLEMLDRENCEPQSDRGSCCSNSQVIDRDFAINLTIVPKTVSLCEL
jgi:hypothetical protein